MKQMPVKRKKHIESERPEQLFMQLADSMPQLVWTAKPDGTVDYYNIRHKEFKGIQRDENGTWKWSPVLHPDDVDLTVTVWENALKTGSIYQVEHRVQRADGSYRWYLSRGVPVLNEAGKIIKWYGTATDIDDTKIAQNAYRESEKKYRSLFDNMTEGFAIHQIITDREGKPVDYIFLEVNNAFELLTGLKKDDLKGKRVLEIMPATEMYWIEKYGRVALTGEPCHFENYSAVLEKWYEVFAYRNSPGEFAVIFTDITDRKRTEKELKQSRESLQQAQAVGKIGNWRLNLTENKLVWSDETYNIFGIEKDTIMTYDLFLSRVHPDDRDYVDRKWKAVVTGDEYDIEHRIIANGTIKWVRQKAHIEFDNTGELRAGFGIVQDITDRKNAEIELEISRRKLDMALENANIGVWEWELPSNRITWDERTDKMFCLAPGSFSGDYEEFLNLVHEEDIEHVRKASRDTLVEDKPYETIFRIKSPDGRYKYISSKALTNRDKEGIIHSLTGVYFDITDLRRGTELLISRLNEELLRSNKELENFAFITSHDLQEPLRMVTSYSQLLEKNYGDKLDERAKEYIRFSVEGGRRMYNLINDLMNYSRISRKEISFKRVDTNRIIEIVEANLSLLIKEKDCIIELKNLPEVFADPDQLVHLFQNLIANSIKFCTTRPHINISATFEKNYHLFSVSDNGIGIESQYYDKIFQVFKRLMPRDQYEGTGIGLAICKRIVENHKGRIWVESELNKGTTFFFTIPQYPAFQV